MQHLAPRPGVMGVEPDDAAIYSKLRDDLLRFANALVGPDEAPDLLSTVLVKLYSSGRSLSDLRDPKPYLMRAVLNQARSSRLRPGVSQHEAVIVASEVRPEVRAAVWALPPQQRAVTYLAYWLGMDSFEISHLLGVRPATVRRYQFLARQKMRRALRHAD